MRSSQQHIR